MGRPPKEDRETTLEKTLTLKISPAFRETLDRCIAAKAAEFKLKTGENIPVTTSAIIRWAVEAMDRAFAEKASAKPVALKSVSTAPGRNAPTPAKVTQEAVEAVPPKTAAAATKETAQLVQSLRLRLAAAKKANPKENASYWAAKIGVGQPRMSSFVGGKNDLTEAQRVALDKILPKLP